MRHVHFLFLFFFTSFSTYSQVDFELGFQHNGRFDFTMIGGSFNNQNNNDVGANCGSLNIANLVSTDNLNLTSGQSIEAAYLYWSSNLLVGDREVTFNGNTVGLDRAFSDRFGQFDFSGAVADVTDIVQANGNGTYTLEDLQLNRTPIGGNCGVSYGGWVCVVVFEDPTLPLNSVNIFDGFRGITSNNGRPPIDIDIDDLLIANDMGSFLGIVAWEGDAGLGGPQFDEEVTFNGEVLSNAINPGDNLFNETNSFNNSTSFFNMDMDRFNIDDFVEIGDQEATIRVESQQDLVIMNVIAFTLGNELPEPTVELLSAEADCTASVIDITFDVNNFNANAILPAGTSVKLFIDALTTPELEVFTQADIPIGGTESFTVQLPYPPGNPTMVKILATVNLDLNGESILLELNSDNNLSEFGVEIAQPPQIRVEPLESCDIGAGVAEFDLDALIANFVMANPTIDISIHESRTDAENEISPITGIFTSNATNQTLFARQFDNVSLCVGIVEFELTTLPNPVVNNGFLEVCADTPIGSFRLSDANDQISTESGVVIVYFATMGEADDGTGAPLPNNFDTISDTVFARVENITTSCFSIAELELNVTLNPELNPVDDIVICDPQGNTGAITTDLSLKDSEVTGNQNPSDIDINYFESQSDAANNTNPITNTTNYTTSANIGTPQTIYFRVDNVLNSRCFIVGEFDIIIFDLPNANDVPISIPTCSSTSTAVFDLTAIALEVADNNTSVNVEFYQTRPDAVNDTNVIPNPGAYDTSTTTIFGRVTDPTTLCFNIGEVSLEVLDNPEEVTGLELIECASDAANTNAIFDLSQFTNVLIGAQQNVTVSYHTSFSDADSAIQGGVNPIADPMNFSGSDGFVYARSEANFFGSICHSVSEIVITVNQRPNINLVTFQLCSNEDTQVFNLASQIDLITGGTFDRTVQFYNTLSGAENATIADEITEPITASSSTIFVRLTNDNTSCFEVAPIQLEVIGNPDIDIEIARSQCIINGVSTFDLTEIITTTATQFPAFDYSLHELETDANADVNALGNEFEIIETQSIFLRYELPGTDCFSVNEVVLDVPETPFQDFGREIICLGESFILPNGEEVFEPGEYFRSIQDPINGCDINTRTELIIGQVEFPTAFTPNGNGVNDTFRALPGNACVGDVTDFRLTVWNRWGEEVYNSTNFLDSWDGSFNNQTQDGIYLWHSTYTFQGDFFERSGSVALFF